MGISSGNSREVLFNKVIEESVQKQGFQNCNKDEMFCHRQAEAMDMDMSCLRF